VLESVDGSTRLEAGDEEWVADSGRLDLLAVVRGLEAIDQPSRVTLVTSSRYVTRGLRFGLDQWKDNDWHWERFGEMTRIKNWDLWQRIDRAMRYHRVECRIWRFDQGEEGVPTPYRRADARSVTPKRVAAKSADRKHPAPRRTPRKGMLAACRRAVGDVLRLCWKGTRGEPRWQAA
jgi:ribonuclease HI